MERQGHRKPPREVCGECGSKKWHLMDGRRFCSNGHESEGFVQFDVGDLDDSGPQGAVARRQREIREREKRHLTGQAGKLLYLEAVQLILRSQVQWLVSEKGHREELETVVRDLWDLRIRGASSLVVPDESAEGELEMFSSQATATEEGGTVLRSKARAQSWDPERGLAWPMPRMPHTLALCYLGCLLLRIPTRIGELVRWANNGNIPYKRACFDLPQEMQDRMPSAYTRALKLPLRSRLVGDELYDIVLDAALSYFLNYSMLFPSINEASILTQYARLLALPVESVVVARRLSAIMQFPLQFAVNKTKMFPLDHPEIVPVALIIVATKLCFPFVDDHPASLGQGLNDGARLNWEQWIDGIANPIRDQKQSEKRLNYDEMTPDRIVSMTDEELDAYFAHVASLVDKTSPNPKSSSMPELTVISDESSITQFFPTETPPVPEPPIPEPSEEEVNETARMLMRQVLEAPNHRDSTADPDASASQKPVYEAFRHVEDISGVAKAFYSTAADLSGLSLEAVVRAVYMLEQSIVTWQKKQVIRARELVLDTGEDTEWE